MRFIIFKEKYEFSGILGKIIVDPVARIRRELKASTFRLKKKPLGMYYIRQGNYFKPKIPKDFNLRFYKVEARAIWTLTSEEVRVDLGLTPGEFEEVLATEEDYHAFFLKGIRKINRNRAIQGTDTGYLHHFKVIWTDSSKNSKKGTLEAYF